MGAGEYATVRHMTPDDAARPTAVIRQLQPGEWAAARAIRLTALAQAADAFASTLEREQAFDEQEWRRRLTETAYLGAWAPGPASDLVGLVATFPEAYPYGPSPGADRTAGRTRHLAAMWVSPEDRGQGIADRLVAAVAALARAQASPTCGRRGGPETSADDPRPPRPARQLIATALNATKGQVAAASQPDSQRAAS